MNEVEQEQLDQNDDDREQSSEISDADVERLNKTFSVPAFEQVDKKVRHRMSNRVRRAREAITRLADIGGPQMVGWLQQVADGVPKRNLKGEPLHDNNGSVMWLVKPDPLGAFKAMSDVMSYHLPRLRSESVEAVVRIEQAELDVATMTTEDLKRFILRQAGVDALDAIDLTAELEPEPVPDWLEPKNTTNS